MSYLPRSSLLTLTLLVIFGYVVFEATGKPMQAKLFPMAVGILGFVLISIQLGRELWTAWTTDDTKPGEKINQQDGAADFAITDVELSRIGRLRAAEQFGWIAGLLAGLFLIGFYIAVPLMVGLYLWRHQERPRFVLIMTVGAAAVVWGLFNQLLNLPFPEGLIQQWLF
jgi:hypothetical protein